MNKSNTSQKHISNDQNNRSDLIKDDLINLPKIDIKKVKTKRANWKNKRHFLMACISFAVGLGNIWRFPALVYEHNGGKICKNL